MRKGLKLSRILACAGIALGLTVIAYTGWKRAYYWQTDVRIVLYVAVPAFIASVSLVSLFLKDSTRLAVLLNGIAVLAAVVGAEAVVELGWVRAQPRPVPTVAPGASAQEPAYGVICGYLFTRGSANPLPSPSVNGKPLLPVGGLSKAPLRWTEVGVGQGIFYLDEMGFANPPAQWQKPIETVTIGDSYAFGLEVAPGKGFVDLLRPSLGPTINLACNGNGPLLELASLAEYGPVLRPKLVLWFYYEGNDLVANLPAEFEQPMLRAYMDGVTQDLYARNDDKDAAWRQVLPPPSAVGGTGMREVTPGSEIRLRTLLTFGALRNAAGLQLDYDPAMLEPLAAILGRAQGLTESWGGQMAFVYLPSEARHQNRVAGWDADAYKRKVLAVAERAGLPVIDAAPAFMAQPQPSLLYQGNHYTPRGYALVADVVRENLARTGLGR